MFVSHNRTVSIVQQIVYFYRSLLFAQVHVQKNSKFAICIKNNLKFGFRKSLKTVFSYNI